MAGALIPAGAARRACRYLVRRGLRGVWLRGALPAGPFVWAGTHHSWWDPFLAVAVLARDGRAPGVLMAQRSLRRYPYARSIGAFGTGELRRGLDLLRRGEPLVVFPEGDLRPGLGPLAPGAAWYAARTGTPLYAVATRVAMRGHQAPEAYLTLSPVPAPSTARSAVVTATELLAKQLSADLAAIDRLIAETDPRLPLPGFDRVIAGRRSGEELADAITGSRVWSALRRRGPRRVPPDRGWRA